MTLSTCLLPLALALFQGADELLPPTPEGWRYERLELPLSFAPEFEYTGYEELRFAPGMFVPGSDTYFSYVLGVRMEEEVEVDAAFVERFLLAYYGGLCDAVASSRGLAFERSSVTVDLRREGRTFMARIEMIDAFTTGAPLSLALELTPHAAAGHTELFGSASPLPADAPVWKELRGMAEAWIAERPPAAHLNHLYLVVDLETYAALAAAESLQQSFRAFEERTTVRGDVSYTGLYFYGEHTYFEFLRADEDAGFLTGDTGIAFGFDDEGGTPLAAQRLERLGVQTFAGPRTREFEGEQVPWFEIMGVQKSSAASRLSLFTLEYDPRFLQQWHADLPPEAGGIARSRILQRYAAKLGANPHSSFRDVSELELALDPAQRARLAEVCAAFGYRAEEEADAVLYHGPRLQLRVRAAEVPGGVTAFTVSKRRLDDEGAPSSFGRVQLNASTFSWTDH